MKTEWKLYDGSRITVESEGEDETTTSISSETDSTASDTAPSDGSDSGDSSMPVPVSSLSMASSPDSSDHGFMTTPFEDYTVTEGLLLLTVIFLALAGILSLFRGRV